MTSHQVLHASPIGALALAADEAGLAMLYFDAPTDFAPTRANAILDETRRQLDAYFAGARAHFDLPLSIHGAPFRTRVWAALREIPFGQTQSYGALAAGIGAPKAARAVGAAAGRNCIGIVIPCHRLIGASGALTGFAGGLARKKFLLDFERKTMMKAA